MVLYVTDKSQKVCVGRTKHVRQSLHPHWDEAFDVTVPHPLGQAPCFTLEVRRVHRVQWLCAALPSSTGAPF